MRRRTRTLHWIERVLFTVAVCAAIWSVFVWLRVEYYKRLPIPAAPSAPVAVFPGPAAILPGEDKPPTHGKDKPRTHTDSGPIRPSKRAGAAKDGRWLARLEGPAINLRATVLEGSDKRTLARAAGHIKNTALPGESGNIGIAGHRDTVFRPLRNIKMGDELKLRTSEATYTYRVSRTSIVDPHEVHVLASTGEPTLTLVTCYPFTFVGSAPRRFIVHATLLK
jgi:sortase A